jgi:SAM-dependent methyltransferase
MAGIWREGRRVRRGARRAALQATWAFEDWRLAAEQRRCELGPAHRRWRGNSAEENRLRWDRWDWRRAGEEWTASPEWKQGLIDDVLARWMPPGGVLLEIGPGGGRWSDALLARASRLILVDVSERPLELCRERFAGAQNVEYLRSSGSDLGATSDASVDGVWSFDVFVHIAPVDQKSYLAELARVLVAGGVAVIHHADGRNRGLAPSRQGWRSPMSRALFASLATDAGLLVESQLDSWGPGGRYDLSAYADAITVCRRPLSGAAPSPPPNVPRG